MGGRLTAYEECVGSIPITWSMSSFAGAVRWLQTNGRRLTRTFGASELRSEGRPPWTPSSLLDFVHSGATPSELSICLRGPMEGRGRPKPGGEGSSPSGGAKSRSSRWSGREILNLATGVRLPYGTPRPRGLMERHLASSRSG